MPFSKPLPHIGLRVDARRQTRLQDSPAAPVPTHQLPGQPCTRPLLSLPPTNWLWGLFLILQGLRATLLPLTLPWDGVWVWGLRKRLVL